MCIFLKLYTIDSSFHFYFIILLVKIKVDSMEVTSKSPQEDNHFYNLELFNSKRLFTALFIKKIIKK